MQKQPKIVLLIGAPSTGKTSVLNTLHTNGYKCFEEISRQIFQEARKQGYENVFKENPLLFSEKLLEGRQKQFISAKKTKAEFVFIDRGLPDITAYLDMVKTKYPQKFDQANQAFKYDHIFLFPLWRDIYSSDNERYEDFQLSKKIEKHLINSYIKLGYDLIRIPKIDVEARANFILSHLIE
jgi:predicted ATPase